MSQDPCPSCGVTPREAELGRQTATLIAGVEQRRRQPAKVDDPVAMIRRLASEYGFDLVERV